MHSPKKSSQGVGRWDSRVSHDPGSPGASSNTFYLFFFNRAASVTLGSPGIFRASIPQWWPIIFLFTQSRQCWVVQSVVRGLELCFSFFEDPTFEHGPLHLKSCFFVKFSCYVLMFDVLKFWAFQFCLWMCDFGAVILGDKTSEFWNVRLFCFWVLFLGFNLFSLELQPLGFGSLSLEVWGCNLGIEWEMKEHLVRVATNYLYNVLSLLLTLDTQYDYGARRFEDLHCEAGTVRACG